MKTNHKKSFFSLSDYREQISVQKDAEKYRNYENERLKLKEDMDAFNETVHEVRKLNNLIKSAVDKLYSTLADDVKNNKSLSNVLKTLKANTSLLSIRMDAFKVINDPISVEKNMFVDLNVFSKVEKVYKSLYDEKKAKNINIQLNGESKLKFKLNNMIEVAFFIIIENAIKYSYPGALITIDFDEIENHTALDVKFSNWGVRPDDEEVQKLTEKGIRSQKAINAGINGNGLGLYILKKICEANHVDIIINIGNENYYQNGLRYSPFDVVLQFRCN